VAKKSPNDFEKLVDELLTDITTDAEKLASFIKDPGSFMKKAKIPKKLRVRIRDAVALKVSKGLVRLMSFHEHH
jgi:hypothetical protein